MTSMEELEQIRRENDGHLYPEAVVDFAKNPATELHKRFDWEDSEAARRWRLHQAGQIIRAAVTIIPSGNNNVVKIRAFVSLPSDRLNARGYRGVRDVLSDEIMFDEHLNRLLADVTALQAKYSVFEPLRPVVAAIVGAVKKARATAKAKRRTTRARRKRAA